MDIVDGHKILRTQPVNPDILPPGYSKIVLKDADSYSPPTYISRRAGIDEYLDVRLLGNSSVLANLAQYRGNKNTPDGPCAALLLGVCTGETITRYTKVY